MSTQYETQGYTINNAGRRLVVDPITRIEGHMRCEVNINECEHQCRLLRHHVSRAGDHPARARPARCVGVR